MQRNKLMRCSLPGGNKVQLIMSGIIYEMITGTVLTSKNTATVCELHFVPGKSFQTLGGVVGVKACGDSAVWFLWKVAVCVKFNAYILCAFRFRFKTCTNWNRISLLYLFFFCLLWQKTFVLLSTVPDDGWC